MAVALLAVPGRWLLSVVLLAIAGRRLFAVALLAIAGRWLLAVTGWLLRVSLGSLGLAGRELLFVALRPLPVAGL